MTPDVYFRIALLIMGRDTLITAFSIIDVITQPQFVKNCGEVGILPPNSLS